MEVTWCFEFLLVLQHGYTEVSGNDKTSIVLGRGTGQVMESLDPSQESTRLVVLTVM